MGSVTHTRSTRLGIKMSGRTRQAEASIGWVPYKQNRPKPATEQQFGDVLALTRKAAEEQKNQGFALTVFTYLNDEAYAQAIAAKNGISRSQHSEMVEFIAAQLAAEDFDIIICEIE